MSARVEAGKPKSSGAPQEHAVLSIQARTTGVILSQSSRVGAVNQPALTERSLQRRWAPEIAPAIGALCLVVAALVWNLRTEIHLESSLPILLLPAVSLPVCFLSAYSHRFPKAVEILFYVSLYHIFVFFSIQLTYHCIAVGYTLQDKALYRADAAIGFDWLSWANFLSAHPLLLKLTNWGYTSYAWQPLVIMPLLAILKPRKGNAELFLSLLFAMVLTLIITAFVPAIGPADALGFRPEPAPVIRALHASPTAQTLKYMGVVTFPSFHTIMAILFTFACRDMRFTFPAAVCLNLIMLVSVPHSGDHYLVDMIAGAIVAVTAISIVKLCEYDGGAHIRRQPSAEIRLAVRDEAV
jgi:PAP2 superfamily